MVIPQAGAVSPMASGLPEPPSRCPRCQPSAPAALDSPLSYSAVIFTSRQDVHILPATRRVLPPHLH